MLRRDELLTLKAATQHLVRIAGGQEACAEASERITRHQSFSEYADRGRLERFISIDTVAEIERFAGVPRVTRQLAELNGYVLFKLPRDFAGLENVSRTAAQAMKETAQVFADYGAAIEDGRISLAEDLKLHEDIIRAIAMLCALDEEITAARIAGERKAGTDEGGGKEP